MYSRITISKLNLMDAGFDATVIYMCNRGLAVYSFQNTAECFTRVQAEWSTHTHTQWFVNPSGQQTRFKTPPAKAHHSVISFVVSIRCHYVRLCSDCEWCVGKNFQVSALWLYEISLHLHRKTRENHTKTRTDREAGGVRTLMSHQCDQRNVLH
jgi:hypothetical protein